jgi:hypothetical protein
MRLHKVLNILLAAVLILAILPFSIKAAETPYVQVIASKTNPAIGEAVTFSVNLKNFNEPSNNLSSFEVKLGFDSSYWELVADKVELGDYIQSLQASQYEMPMNSVSGANGTVHMALSIYKNDAVTYFSGDGTLFTFSLKPKKNGVTDVSIAKSLFVQISKPGVNVSHSKVASNIDIGGATPPPPPPPTDNGGGGTPGQTEVIPLMPAEVERNQTPMDGGKKKETIRFNGENVKKTIEQAIKSKSKGVEIKASGNGAQEADFISFTASKETITQLVANNLYFVLTSEKGQLEWSVDTLKSLGKDLNIDLFLVTDAGKVENTKRLITQHVKNGRSVGQSTEITTNFSGKTKVTLPLNAGVLPTSATNLANFLKTLGVFVQHSDGTVEYVKGEIQYDKNGKPVGISIMVNRFSTFTVVSEASAASKIKFVDDKEISPYAYEAVYKAQELGIMSGLSSEPRFGPSQALTRAQFTKIIVKMLGEDPSTAKNSKPFKDVPVGNWAHGYVMKAVELGIIKGITADTFNPSATITREQVALMIGRAYKIKPIQNAVTFKDQGKINKEALPYIQALQQQKIIMGSNGAFNPKQTVTREMAAVIAVRVMGKY